MKTGIEAQRIFRAHKHGMDVVALELMRRLQQKDPAGQYCLFTANGPDTRVINETGNFQIRRLPALSYADWEQWSLPRAVRRYRPDLLHCTANTAPLHCPVPLVLTLHDIIFLEETSFRGSAYQNLGNVYRKWVVPPAIKTAASIITVSQYERGVIAARFPEAAAKIRVIYHGVDEAFHPNVDLTEEAAFRRQHGLPEAYILLLGNTAPKKNTANAIRAYNEYCRLTSDPLPLVITDFSREQTDRILSHLGHLPAGRVICTGYLPRAMMPLLYRCSSLFLYPSLRESFGLPILEAMASGIPVITSNTSAMPEIAGDAAVLSAPHDPVAIGEAIGELLSDENQYALLKQKGLMRAAQFSWDRAVNELLEVYQMTSIESP